MTALFYSFHNIYRMTSLTGKVCVVTGATRGIGKGIALQLGEAGATVYITGRTLDPKPGDAVGGSLKETAKEIESRGGKCIAVICDHNKDSDIAQLFERVDNEQNGQLDVLVNNAYAAVQAISDNMKIPFWEQPLDMWDTVNSVGLRNHYLCSIYASRLMVPKKRGLIVNVSSPGGISYTFNIPYGVGKEACDRMAADCANELRKYNVNFVSLWPGLVRTEYILNMVKEEGFAQGRVSKEMFDQGESIEYPGKAVLHLAADPNVHKKTGKIMLTADLGQEYGFKDIDGASPVSMRNLKLLLTYVPEARWLAKYVPGFIYLPGWMLSLAGNKF